MSHANTEIAERAYEAFGRGDIEAVLENFAEGGRLKKLNHYADTARMAEAMSRGEEVRA
jgi:hypothetical protein